MASTGKLDSSLLSINCNEGIRTSKWRIGLEVVESNGFYYNEAALQYTKAVHDLFQPRPDDVFLCSAMKTGTTWMKAILASITNSTELLKEKGPHDLIPQLGLSYYGFTGPSPVFSTILSEMPSPRVLHTHTPYNALPHSIKSLGCRIIYIARNPKDAFVSYWKFIDKFRLGMNVEGDFAKEDAFADFCSGVCLFRPYIHHILEYWNASKENSNFLFLTYEDLMADTCSCIRRIADFIGRTSLSEGEIARIAEDCSFKSLTSFDVNQTGKVGNSGFHNRNYFRNGKVGDWKNHITDEMSRRLDCLVERKLEGSGLCFKYELSESSERSASEMAAGKNACEPS